MAKYFNVGTESHFFCTECGLEGLPVLRKKGQERKSGHLKKLYCLHCGKETNHAEIKDFSEYDYDKFYEEFKMGRFKDGNRIPINELFKCSNIQCPFNKEGICWNGNNSENCKYKPI